MAGEYEDTRRANRGEFMASAKVKLRGDRCAVLTLFCILPLAMPPFMTFDDLMRRNVGAVGVIAGAFMTPGAVGRGPQYDALRKDVLTKG